MKIIFETILRTLSILGIAVILIFNVRFYKAPHLDDKIAVQKDVGLQLNFLENQLKKFALGSKMQKLYPEGQVFINVLYGLSYCEMAKLENQKTAMQKRALEEAQFAFDQINSADAKKNYDKDLIPAYGIFYRGWQNYLLGKIISIQAKANRAEIDMFKKNCNEIADAFSSSPNPYLHSYRNASWPADAFVAMASLKLYDQLFEIKYDTLIQNWLTKVKTNLDPATGLVPHEMDNTSGKILEGARGSSISLMLLFLSDLDKDFAKQQFAHYKKYFLIACMGLPAIREYPMGKEGQGDVDSGPVVFAMSFPGTILSISTFCKMNEFRTATSISNSVENFGLPIVSKQQKKFLFGNYPMADAFIAWARIQSVQSAQVETQNYFTGLLKSTIYIHVVSLLIISFIIIFLKRISSY